MTWYGDDIPGTLKAFDRMLDVMSKHHIDVPSLDVFRVFEPR
jgi:hypothetical protein